MTRLRAALVAALLALCLAAPQAQFRLADESDRAAFRAWFTLLADAQYYRPTPDVTDCSGLVRHAVREALRGHTAEWLRHLGVPGMPTPPDVRRRPAPAGGSWPVFRVAPTRYAEFANARTLVRYNARAMGRRVEVARPGDLLFFHRDNETASDHLMVYVGPSAFDRSATDWIVYHTGPEGAREGEVRKLRLAELRRHPSPRWRPVLDNPAFVGVFRLASL